MTSKLTQKQKAFIEYFNGNATESAKMAGYNGNDQTLSQIGYENMKKPEIRQEIEKRNLTKLEPFIADRQRRQEFWTDIMHDSSIQLKDRLKASELLGRSEGDFFPKEDTGGESDLLTILKKMHERRKLRKLGEPKE